MKIENNGGEFNAWSDNHKIILTIFIFILFTGTTASGAFYSDLNSLETRATYELKIEVDYFEGLLYPEVIEAFDFLESYFESRGIPTEVDFNSTYNIIEGNPYVDDGDLRTIERQYHDQLTTHIYFIVAKRINGIAGGASPIFGAAIGLELASNYDVRFLVMHEFGHCIGIGLQDDDDNEVYSSSGFMGYYCSNITEYDEADWNSSFAPDGAFGNQTRKQARMWNRYSVQGELYDDTADVTGTFSDAPRNVTLKEIDGPDECVAHIDVWSGNFYLQPHPGNYTLEVSDAEYQLNEIVYVNVTERQVLNLGNITLEPVQTQPVETSSDDHTDDHTFQIGIVVVLVIVIGIVITAYYRKHRYH